MLTAAVCYWCHLGSGARQQHFYPEQTFGQHACQLELWHWFKNLPTGELIISKQRLLWRTILQAIPQARRAAGTFSSEGHFYLNEVPEAGST